MNLFSLRSFALRREKCRVCRKIQANFWRRPNFIYKWVHPFASVHFARKKRRNVCRVCETDFEKRETQADFIGATFGRPLPDLTSEQKGVARPRGVADFALSDAVSLGMFQRCWNKNSLRDRKRLSGGGMCIDCNVARPNWLRYARIRRYV